MGGAEGCGPLSLAPLHPAHSLLPLGLSSCGGWGVAGVGGQALVIQLPCCSSHNQCFLWSLSQGLCTSVPAAVAPHSPSVKPE